MKKDAHYYAVLGFSRACGFKKDCAQDIAFASQYVDDAKINHIVIDGTVPNNIQPDIIDNQPSFFNMATCHSYTKVKTFNYSAMINNTSAFHFVPGCKGQSFTKKLRCRQESPVILKILEDALGQDDLIRLGLVLHPFADTFSHQGFSGLLSKVNDIKNIKSRSNIPLSGSASLLKVAVFFFGKGGFDRRIDSVMPAYGHGQAMEYPDLPYEKWSYEYDYSDQFSCSYKSSGLIDNRVRYKTAFEKIRTYLTQYLENHPQYSSPNVNFNDFETLFDTLLTEAPDPERIKNWKRTLINTGLYNKNDPQLIYDEYMWLNDAFENFKKKKFNQRKVTDARLDGNFINSNWYKFYQAVKWYKDKFFQYCSDNGLDICR